jgi:hypothetical protein
MDLPQGASINIWHSDRAGVSAPQNGHLGQTNKSRVGGWEEKSSVNLVQLFAIAKALRPTQGKTKLSFVSNWHLHLGIVVA